MPTHQFVKSITLCWQLCRCADRQFTIQNVNFYKYSMCLCRNIGLLKRVVNILHLLPRFTTMDSGKCQWYNNTSPYTHLHYISSWLLCLTLINVLIQKNLYIIKTPLRALITSCCMHKVVYYLKQCYIESHISPYKESSCIGKKAALYYIETKAAPILISRSEGYLHCHEWDPSSTQPISMDTPDYCNTNFPLFSFISQ